jgi:hypothetical protein
MTQPFTLVSFAAHLAIDRDMTTVGHAIVATIL